MASLRISQTTIWMSSKKVPAERVTQGQDPLSAIAEATLKWGAREFLTRSSLQDVVLFLGSTLCCTPPPTTRHSLLWFGGVEHLDAREKLTGPTGSDQHRFSG